MRFEFNRTGAERKSAGAGNGEILEVKPKYLGMPTAAYQVDYFHIDKTGAVEFDDRADSEEIENLLERLAERGIVAAPAETAQGRRHGGKKARMRKTNAEEPETERTGGRSAGAYGGNAEDSFTDAALENLRKAGGCQGRSLIKKASWRLTASRLKRTGRRFPSHGLQEGQDSESVKAYTHFVAAICDMAKGTRSASRRRKKPWTMKNTPSGASLLRLGFIGAEYKGASGKSC